MRAKAWVCSIAVVLFVLVQMATAADDKAADMPGIDQEGFLQRWLLVLPIPLADGESGLEAVDKQQIKDEAKLQPKAGDKIKVGSKEFTWKAENSVDFLVDFNAILGDQTENSVAYAFTLVVAPEELVNIKMKVGSDDEAKIYLNGKEVYKCTDQRPTDKDQDTVNVTLKKGVNVLVAKVVNDSGDWSFCVRFTDKNDKPLTNLKSKTAE